MEDLEYFPEDSGAAVNAFGELEEVDVEVGGGNKRHSKKKMEESGGSRQKWTDQRRQLFLLEGVLRFSLCVL